MKRILHVSFRRKIFRSQLLIRICSRWMSTLMCFNMQMVDSLLNESKLGAKYIFAFILCLQTLTPERFIPNTSHYLILMICSSLMNFVLCLMYLFPYAWVLYKETCLICNSTVKFLFIKNRKLLYRRLILTLMLSQNRVIAIWTKNRRKMRMVSYWKDMIIKII